MLDVILPTLNTIKELYDRSKLGKTEKIYLINVIMEISELLKFNLTRDGKKQEVFAMSVAGSEEATYYAKFAAVRARCLVAIQFSSVMWKTNWIRSLILIFSDLFLELGATI